MARVDQMGERDDVPHGVQWWREELKTVSGVMSRFAKVVRQI